MKRTFVRYVAIAAVAVTCAGSVINTQLSLSDGPVGENHARLLDR
ncbi:MAG: hypothetical protein AAGF27_06590 [Pseudomonadota bacterium]